MTADPLAVYFEYAMQESRQVALEVGTHESTYAVGGYEIDLKFIGDALWHCFNSALAHNRLQLGERKTDLLVYLWDTVSTGTLLKPPPWEAISYAERGNRRIYVDDEYVLVYDRRTCVFNMVDLRRGEALYWVNDPGWLPFWEIAAPLRYLFQGWLQGKGSFIVHAGGVGLENGGALILGRTGSGKSTTSLQCMESGLGFAGDDYMLVRPSPNPVAYSLYNSAKINASDIYNFPRARNCIANPDRLDIEKALCFLHDDFGERLIRSFPICVVILPRIGKGAHTAYQRLPALEVFKQVAPDSVFTMLGNAPLIFRGIRQLTQAVPCYQLTLGHDRFQVADRVAELIGRHSD